MKELPVGVDIDDDSTWGLLANYFNTARKRALVQEGTIAHPVPGELMFGELIFAPGHNGPIWHGEYYASFKIVIDNERDAKRWPALYQIMNLELFVPQHYILSEVTTIGFDALVADVGITIPCHEEECHVCGVNEEFDFCAPQLEFIIYKYLF